MRFTPNDLHILILLSRAGIIIFFNCVPAQGGGGGGGEGGKGRDTRERTMPKKYPSRKRVSARARAFITPNINFR